MGRLHGRQLLLRVGGVGIDAEQEGKEGVEEALRLIRSQMGERLLQTAGNRPQRAGIGPLEVHQIFQPAVSLMS